MEMMGTSVVSVSLEIIFAAIVVLKVAVMVMVIVIMIQVKVILSSWGTTPCCSASRFQRFRGMWCLHLVP
jgi:hypothetical protein